LVLLTVLLLAPGPALGRTTGLRPGYTAVYSYKIDTTYVTPFGNVTNTFYNEFTINIESVDTEANVGEVGYTLTVTIANSTEVATDNVVSNFTTIFDPYDNRTYVGNIGFLPFVYTDLQAGPVRNLGVKWTTPSYVNGSVVKEPGFIDVNFTIMSDLSGNYSSRVAKEALRFNASTGLLESGYGAANIYSTVWRYGNYKLLSYTHQAGFSVDPMIVAIALGIVAAALVVMVVVGRRTPSEKKAAQMREKFGRSH
jgi:hypothetical protein